MWFPSLLPTRPWLLVLCSALILRDVSPLYPRRYHLPHRPRPRILLSTFLESNFGILRSLWLHMSPSLRTLLLTFYWSFSFRFVFSPFNPFDSFLFQSSSLFDVTVNVVPLVFDPGLFVGHVSFHRSPRPDLVRTPSPTFVLTSPDSLLTSTPRSPDHIVIRGVTELRLISFFPVL